jgi:thiaminase (transcriptional activator TenA)
MLHDDLIALADPVLRAVQAHPFWVGLGDGSLPAAGLARFVAQDTDHLLPAYARALARTAAAAPGDAHAALLARSAFSSIEARDRLRGAYAELAPTLHLPALAAPGATGPDPATRAHCAWFTASAATSFAAGVGALLPMVWFNHRVADRLLERHVRGSRYAPWVAAYHPGPGYPHAVRAFLALADAVGERAGADGRAELIEHFAVAVEHELAFAGTAWQAAHASTHHQERTTA